VSGFSGLEWSIGLLDYGLLDWATMINIYVRRSLPKTTNNDDNNNNNNTSYILNKQEKKTNKKKKQAKQCIRYKLVQI